MKKVVICQYRLLHYRLELFERLRKACEDRDIRLELVHGQPTRREEPRGDVGALSWATVVTNRYVEIGQQDILWQPFPRKHHDADLVVLVQESRLLSNYLWLTGWNGKEVRVAYWGHGRNFQSDHPQGLRERWKSIWLGRVDWWFAYTEMTRDILLAGQYPDERITVLENAIDNEGFRRDLEETSSEELSAARASIDANAESPVGLYCGSLWRDKRVDLMIAVGDRVQAALPSFKFVIIGDGPSARDVEAAATTRPWLKWVGTRKGREKATYFRLADVVLNPGAVGLQVVDAFCAGLPLVTTADARHGPEISYLHSGVNGLIVSGSVEEYSASVISLLRDRSRHESIRLAAMQDAKRYTLDNMVARFADGIAQCVSMPKK